MRRLFCKNFAKFTSFSDPHFRPEVEEEGEGEEEGEVEGADLRNPHVCSWCSNPTDPADTAKPEVTRLAQIYHDAYREAHQECPAIGKPEFGGLKRALSEGKSFARIVAVLRHGVLSQEPWLVNRGHKINDLLANYQGISQALARGQIHGQRHPQKGPSHVGTDKDPANSWQ